MVLQQLRKTRSHMSFSIVYSLSNLSISISIYIYLYIKVYAPPLHATISCKMYFRIKNKQRNGGDLGSEENFIQNLSTYNEDHWSFGLSAGKLDIYAPVICKHGTANTHVFFFLYLSIYLYFILRELYFKLLVQ